MSRYEVSALIVTWNNANSIKRCLEALRLASGSVSTEVLLWDNASTDGTADLVRSLGFSPVCSDVNVGFAAGMNHLARSATGRFLLILNPDVYLDRGALSALLRRAQSVGGDCVVGGELRGLDGDVQRACARPLVDANSLVLACLLGTAPRWKVPHAAAVVPAVSGALMLTTCSLWNALGGFDVGYVHSSEDLDFCWRASRQGFPTWFEPSASATHVLGESVRQAPPQIDAIRWAGAIRFVLKRQGTAAAMTFRIALAVRTAVSLVLHKTRLRPVACYRRERARLLFELAVRGTSRATLPNEPQ